MENRSRRSAENEAVFRRGNEAIEANRSQASGVQSFICECGADDCLAQVEVTREEYESVRAHPARFLVVPGHEDLSSGEVVISETPGYLVVEKTGADREIVERRPPR